MQKGIFFSLALCSFLFAQNMDINTTWYAGGWRPALTTDGDFFYLGHNNNLAVARQENGQLLQIGVRTLDYTPRIIKIFGNTAYAAHENAINLFDISDPTRPTPTRGFAFDTAADEIQDFTVNNGIIYITVFNKDTKEGALRIVDYSNPASPRFGRLKQACQGIAVKGTTAFVITGHRSIASNLISLTSYNVADISNIRKLDDIRTGGADNVYIHNNLAFTGGSGQGGMTIIDISNPGNLQYLVQDAGDGPIRKVVAKGNFAYAATWTEIVTFNIGNPAVPNPVDRQEISQATINMLQLDAANDRLVALHGGELGILDISTPGTPQLQAPLEEFTAATSIAQTGDNLFAADGARIWRFETALNDRQSKYLEIECNKIYIHQDLLFVTGPNKFTIFDISNINNPVQRGVYKTDFNIMVMAFSDTLAFVAAASFEGGDHKITVVDIRNPNRPEKFSQKMLPGAAIDMAVSANASTHLVVAYHHPGTRDSGFLLYNINDPVNLVQKSHTVLPGKPTALWADGPLLLVSSITQDEDGWFLEAYDIHNPAGPVLVANTDSGGEESIIHDIDMAGGTVYAAASQQGLLSFSLHPVESAGKKTPIEQIPAWVFSLLANDPQFKSFLEIIANPGVNGHAGSENVVTGTRGSIYYGSQYRKGYDGLARLRQRRQQPDPRFFATLMMRISPVKANNYCSVTPGPGRHTYLRRSTVQITAIDDPQNGWYFKEWQGAGAGAVDKVATVFMDIDRDVDAVFEMVSLTVSGKKPKRVFCPDEILEYNRLEMTPITFCASEADDWLLSKFTIRAGGSGHEVDDLKNVYVWADLNDYFVGTFNDDDGTIDVVFEPALVVGAGDCISMKIGYEFDFDAMNYAADTSKTFALHTMAVAAEPIHFPTGLIQGQAGCDTLRIARVFNTRGNGFAHIQAAIDDPTTSPGDTCHVCPGYYSENITVDKSVVIKAKEDYFKTTISGVGANSHVFTVNENNVSIEGFTLCNSEPQCNECTGIYLDHVKNIKIADNKIDTTLSMGIRSLVLEKCRILNNIIENRINLDMASHSKISGNHFYSRPRRSHGRALQLSRVAVEDTISNNRFHVRSDIGVTGGDQCVIHANRPDSPPAAPNNRQSIVLSGTWSSEISRNKHFSISLYSDSDNNTIEYNETPLIELSDAGRNIIRHNTIDTNPDYVFTGIRLVGDAEGLVNNHYDYNYFSRGNIVEENVVSGSFSNGIALKWCTDTIIRNNTIHHCDGQGIDMYICGKTRIHDNTIYRNTQSGINGWYCDNPIIHDNRITWHENNGKDSGYGVMLENVIGAKIYSNQLLRNCTGLEIDNNRMHMHAGRYNTANNFIGLNVFNDSFCLFTGIHLIDSKASIFGNNIQNNNGAGIAMSHGSEPEIWSNNIAGNDGFQVSNDDETTAPDLSGNWWGHPDGPGETAISGNILISSWLPGPVSLLVAAEMDTVYAGPGTEDSVWVYLQNLVEPDDIVSIDIQDELGWITPVSGEQSMKDSSGVTLRVNYTVPADVTTGTVNQIKIQAVSAWDNVTSAADSFLILTYQPVPAALTIAPDSLVLQPDSKAVFSAVAVDQYDYPYIIDVEWTATNGLFNQQGVFTAGTVLGPVEIRATDPISGLTASTAVLVTDQQPVLTELTISPQLVELGPGGTELFGLDANDQFGFPFFFPVKWMATGGTIDAYGIYTAGTQGGTFSVTAGDSAGTITADATVVIDGSSEIKNGPAIPGNFALYQNYPNPFNPVTTIEFYVMKHSRVTLEMYNILGHKIETLLHSSLSPGLHQVQVDAGQYASGVYFYKIRMGGFTDMKKMLLVK